MRRGGGEAAQDARRDYAEITPRCDAAVPTLSTRPAWGALHMGKPCTWTALRMTPCEGQWPGVFAWKRPQGRHVNGTWGRIGSVALSVGAVRQAAAVRRSAGAAGGTRKAKLQRYRHAHGYSCIRVRRVAESQGIGGRLVLSAGGCAAELLRVVPCAGEMTCADSACYIDLLYMLCNGITACYT